MTDVDPRLAYLNARKAYAAALKVTKAHARLLSGVGEQLSRSPQAFIDVTIDGKKSGGLYTAWELDRWPSADDLRRDALSLRATFEESRIHWASLPEEDREASLPLPKSLGAD